MCGSPRCEHVKKNETSKLAHSTFIDLFPIFFQNFVKSISKMELGKYQGRFRPGLDSESLT